MAITYNGVTIPFCFTEAHSSGPEKDPSGVDTLYTKTTIRVRGVIHAQDVPHLVGETPAATADRITHLLTTPRRPLTYSVGNTVMIAVNGRDDANGPEPDPAAFTCTPLEGSFVVTFAVTVRLRRCTGADGRSGVLSLKWTDQESFDLKGNKTRRRSGTLVVSRNFTPNADDRRGLVLPLIPPGMRRDSADYTLSEDGLRLRFVFVDRQLHKGVPWPAVKVSGTMVETSPKNGVGMRRGELAVRLEGRPGTDARDLLNAAIRIGMSRVYASNPNPIEGTNKILIGGGVRESLNDDETAVELSLSWAIRATSARLTGAKQPTELRSGASTGASIGLTVGGPGGAAAGAFIGSWFGGAKTPEGRAEAAVPTLAPWLGLDFPGADLAAGVPSAERGTDLAAAVRPLAALLLDPCGSAGGASLAAGDNGWVGTSGGSTLTARTGTPAADDTDGVYADDAPNGVWEEWTMLYSFTTESGYTVLPSTVPGQPGRRVRWGSAAKRLRVEWHLKRTGDAPILPEPKVPRPGGYTGDGTHDDNWVGVTNTTTYDNVDVAADGVSYMYTAAGVTEWKAVDPAKAGEAYPCPPFLAPAKRPAPASVSPPPPPALAGQFPGNPFGPYAGQSANPFGGPNPLA